MQKLVIIGTSKSHVHLLLALTQQALEGVQVTLIAPTLRQLYDPMLADFICGLASAQACLIDLEPLLKSSGIRWLPLSVSALDASTQTLTLSDASRIAFDWLSLNTVDIPDLAQLELKLPGAQAHGLLLHPSDAFAQRWPAVLAQAQTRTLRIAVLGDSLQGVEVALAIRYRLPGASITLVMDGAQQAKQGRALQARLVLALKNAHITVLDDHAVALRAGEVMLGCGATLVCDLPIVALRVQPPAWLAASALTRDPQGHVATDPQHRALSHPPVFAADQGADASQQTRWQCLSTQVAAEQAYAHTLMATLKGQPRHANKTRTAFFFMSSGSAALACGAFYCFQGTLLWRLKHRLDRAAVQRMRRS